MKSGTRPAPGKSKGGGPRGEEPAESRGVGSVQGASAAARRAPWSPTFQALSAPAGLAWPMAFLSWVTEQQAAPMRAIRGPGPARWRSGDPLLASGSQRAHEGQEPAALLQQHAGWSRFPVMAQS
jgi:hypothetical protein